MKLANRPRQILVDMGEKLIGQNGFTKRYRSAISIKSPKERKFHLPTYVSPTAIMVNTGLWNLWNSLSQCRKLF